MTRSYQTCASKQSDFSGVAEYTSCCGDGNDFSGHGAAKDNMIRDEWIVRDNGALARQMGLTPEVTFLRMIEIEGGLE